MRKFSFETQALLFCTSWLFAGCEEPPRESEKQPLPSLEKEGADRGEVKIPVVFHVFVDPNQPDKVLHESALRELLNQLNTNFSNKHPTAALFPPSFMQEKFGAGIADTQIRFGLAKQDDEEKQTRAINYIDTYTINEGESLSLNDIEDELWDPTKFLNIVFVPMQGGSNLEDLVGAASYNQDIDAVIFDSAAFTILSYPQDNELLNAAWPGLKPKDHLAAWFTREVGRYFGLKYIWGTSDLKTTNFMCQFEDTVADTPIHSKPTGFLTAVQFPYLGDECNTVEPGSMYMTFMDVSKAVSLFTTGQGQGMQNNLNTTRASLKTSPGTQQGACLPDQYETNNTFAMATKLVLPNGSHPTENLTLSGTICAGDSDLFLLPLNAIYSSVRIDIKREWYPGAEINDFKFTLLWEPKGIESLNATPVTVDPNTGDLFIVENLLDVESYSYALAIDPGNDGLAKPTRPYYVSITFGKEPF